MSSVGADREVDPFVALPIPSNKFAHKQIEGRAHVVDDVANHGRHFHRYAAPHLVYEALLPRNGSRSDHGAEWPATQELTDLFAQFAQMNLGASQLDLGRNKCFRR